MLREVLSAIFPPSHNAREAYPSTFWIIYKLLLLASVNKGSAKNIDFFYLGFLSRKQGKGKGNLFNSSLPLPPASHLDISPAIIADSSLHLLLPWFCLDLMTKSVFLSFKWVMHLMEGNLEYLNCFVVVAEWCMEFGDDVNNKNEDRFLKPISYALKFQEVSWLEAICSSFT